MLGRNSFFKTRKPRRFNYQPLYWDPEAEEREKRLRWQEKGEEEQSIRFREAFQEKQGKRTRNIRLAVIVLLLLLTFILFW